MTKKSKRHSSKRQIEAKQEDNLASKVVKWLFILLISLVLIFGIVFGVNVMTGGFGSDDETVAVDIPSGATANDVATILADNDIVANDKLFSLYMRLSGKDEIQAGHYELPKSAGFGEASDILAEGGLSGETYKLAIPEGTNLEGIADIVADASDYSADEFMEVAKSDKFFDQLKADYPDMLGEVADKDDVRYKLEGYLYPATYDIGKDESIEDIIHKMVDNMNNVYVQHQSERQHSDLSFHEVLTLASLVEAEAPETADRQKIAGVFFNRLNQDMPIQSDISISYALNEHRPYVTYDDTEVDSPYNLYKNTGLGPGPFNNPGVEAIEATLEPEDTDYLYFVADLKTGKVYYAKTYEEHMELVDKYVSEDNADM
ncbi:endolytic transglycosylase MltG [Aerococcus suis]|uniref:Endolytic murein transglycosylase n=1 Tax=Aerococcus suis TaxID=371602 RepID=A0A1W1Y631_9LACT|nr:endolytic transglycosylase MltG [Aerococcus suis]MDY4646954.1 endolytic transglycosylase MltG [Aerococcus suis]SMC31607.1 UPF0755 protein [Aerococcus suis]